MRADRQITSTLVLLTLLVSFAREAQASPPVERTCHHVPRRSYTSETRRQRAARAAHIADSRRPNSEEIADLVNGEKGAVLRVAIATAAARQFGETTRGILMSRIQIGPRTDDSSDPAFPFETTVVPTNRHGKPQEGVEPRLADGLVWLDPTGAFGWIVTTKPNYVRIRRATPAGE